MQGLLVFVLPAGRSAEVKTPIARLICDRLWGQGIEPGAATAATRIAESLHTHVAFRGELLFNERELAPLLDAAEIHPQTWADLLHASNLAAISVAQRTRLFATCEHLIGRSREQRCDHHQSPHDGPNSRPSGDRGLDWASVPE